MQTFTPRTRPGTQATDIALTLGTTGMGVLSADAMEYLGFPRRIKLSWDREPHMIVVQATTADDPAALKVSAALTRRGTGSGAFSISGALRSWSLPLPEKKRRLVGYPRGAAIQFWLGTTK